MRLDKAALPAENTTLNIITVFVPKKERDVRIRSHYTRQMLIPRACMFEEVSNLSMNLISNQSYIMKHKYQNSYDQH